MRGVFPWVKRSSPRNSGRRKNADQGSSLWTSGDDAGPPDENKTRRGPGRIVAFAVRVGGVFENTDSVS